MDVSDPLKFSFAEILKIIIIKAKEDGIISSDESDLIKQIEFDAKNIEEQLKTAVMDSNTKIALEKLFKTAGETLIKNAISIARKDTNVSTEEKMIIEQVINSFSELGWDTTEWKKKRIWYVFKIVIVINSNTNVDNLLNAFEKKFCLLGLDPATGICLGTNHYIMEDIDVTLLAFTLNPDNEMEWVRKGAFAFIEFDNEQSLKHRLRRTAQDLLAKHYVARKVDALSR